MNDIKIWAQMFFDDGSVSQGIRIPVETLDDDRLTLEVAQDLAGGLNRTEGVLLIWGAGFMFCGHLLRGQIYTKISTQWMTISFSEQESDSSASSPE